MITFIKGKKLSEPAKGEWNRKNKINFEVFHFNVTSIGN